MNGYIYKETDYADPPIDVLEDNLRRLIIMSRAAFEEVGAERAIFLPVIDEEDIIAGPGSEYDHRSITIEAREGEETLSPSRLNIERVSVEVRIRTGTEGTLQEQKKRAAAYCTVIKRIVRKIDEGGHNAEWTAGWPADDIGERKRAPIIRVLSISQYPVAQAVEEDYGYVAGIRISLQIQYQPVI